MDRPAGFCDRTGQACPGRAAWQLVRVVCALAALLAVASPARAQQAPVAADSNRPFEITDNSFLVEEALNQEPGVFQNIFNVGLNRSDDWVATFTQEWPLFTRTHQISYTVPYDGVGRESGLGDIAVHYRLQALTGEGAWPALSPRLSLIVPTGSASKGFGQGHAGLEVNLPVSKQVRDFHLHANAGFAYFPAVDIGTVERSVLTPRVAGSAIWRARPMLNLMLESVAEWASDDDALSSSRRSRVTVSPGVRTGWNIGDAQTIIGVAVPIVFANSARETGVFLYASYELPFTGR